MHVNWTPEWNVIGIWISRELPFYNFEHLDISWASIIHTSQKLGPFEFAESFRLQFRRSRYMMHVNRTSKSKLIAIWISWELLLFNFERLDISWALIIHSSQKLWPFEFAESFLVQFRGSWYIMCVNRTSEWKVTGIWISRELPLFNFERLEISWASIIHMSQKLWPFEFVESFRVEFRRSWYKMHVNRTSAWNVITIWISQELLLFNFEPLDISWASIIHSSQRL